MSTHSSLAAPYIFKAKISDDDHFETAIYVRFADLSIRQSPETGSSPSLAPMEVESDPPTSDHGTTDDSSAACCRRSCDEGLVDCSACLKAEWAALSASLDPEELKIADSVATVVAQGREKGVTKDLLLVCPLCHLSVLKLTVL